jgi:hypothetical protein
MTDKEKLPPQLITRREALQLMLCFAAAELVGCQTRGNQYDEEFTAVLPQGLKRKSGIIAASQPVTGHLDNNSTTGAELMFADQNTNGEGNPVDIQDVNEVVETLPVKAAEQKPEPDSLLDTLGLEPGVQVPMEMSFDLSNSGFGQDQITISFNGNLQLAPNQLGADTPDAVQAILKRYQEEDRPGLGLGNFRYDSYGNLMLFIHTGRDPQDLRILLEAETLRRLLETQNLETLDLYIEKLREHEDINARLNQLKSQRVMLNGNLFAIAAVAYIPQPDVPEITQDFTQSIARLAERNLDFSPFLSNDPSHNGIILQFCGQSRDGLGRIDPTYSRYYLFLQPYRG